MYKVYVKKNGKDVGTVSDAFAAAAAVGHRQPEHHIV